MLVEHPEPDAPLHRGQVLRQRGLQHRGIPVAARLDRHHLPGALGGGLVDHQLHLGRVRDDLQPAGDVSGDGAPQVGRHQLQQPLAAGVDRLAVHPYGLLHRLRHPCGGHLRVHREQPFAVGRVQLEQPVDK